MVSSAQGTHNDNPGLVERPRLITKINQAAQHRLTLISAPPGYGKTTLASQFIRQSPLPIAWHTIEASQRDVPILHHQALAALESFAPGIDSLPDAYGYPPHELASHIADYLRDSLTGEGIYILDDAHHLTGSPAAETWLRALVEQIPDSCHILIISRVLPDLPLTEMIARREILAIGQEELKFRRDEIHHLATHLRGEPPNPTEVEDWEVRLEGWPAGTVLALQPLPEELARVMLRGGIGPEALFNDLARSMLQAQPPDMRDFLLATSTLPRVTPDLCSQALELPDSAGLLTQAISRNMFLSRVTGGLAYHALFRDFLQQQLQQSDPARFYALHRQTAQWFEAHDQIIEAVDHYLIANEVSAAARLADHVAHAFFTQGKVETLLAWGKWLSQARDDIPHLLCTCAKVLYHRYEYDEADACLLDAEKAFARRGDAEGLLDFRVVQAMVTLQRGDYPKAAAQAQDILEEAATNDHLYGRALTVIGTAHMNMGDAASGVHYLEQALPVYEADGDSFAISSALQNLDVVYRRLGRLDEAAACLQRVVAIRRDLGRTGALALALNNLGFHYHQYSDYEQALSTYEEGLAVVARVPNQRTESYLRWSMADLQRDRGAFSEALQLYHKALEVIEDGEPELRGSILINMSTLYRWQNNHRQAITCATEASALADQHRLGLIKMLAHAAIWGARSSTRSDQAHEAQDKLAAVAADLQAAGAQVELVQVLGLAAYAAALHNDLTTAHSHLNEAISIADQIGSAQVLAAEVFHSSKLHAVIEPDQPAFERLATDLMKIKAAQYAHPEPIDRLPSDSISQDTYRLRVQTFGQQQVDRDGARLTTSDWRANAARELFFYILFAGPATRDEINLTFWPDGSSKSVRQRFHTTLHRARNALGENAIIFQDNLYQLNPATEIWCDAHELESLTTQARLLSPRDARTEDLWGKAVDLCKGEFLPSLDADWVMSRREYLHEAYIEALIGLGECARARGDVRAALSAFKRALDKEPYREDINRAIMICYADLGEKHRIISHLNQLKQLLWQELAIDPSPETIELANRLLA